ncbi:hypothetical protein GOV04_01485 [Candidatus Woesearchaeota archaeon]|nr:hypothetical protein [Candidatus Woesearchaeota archaeon]
MQVENIIIRGKYYFPGKFERIKDIKRIIMNYMGKKSYEPEDTRDLFSLDGFSTINFQRFLGKDDIPLKFQIKKFLRLISEDELSNNLYFERMRKLRNELPFEVQFRFTSEKKNGRDIISIKIISIPVIYYKMAQLSNKIVLSDFDHSNIVYTNIEFIKEVMDAIHAVPIEPPQAMSHYVKTKISDTLKEYKYDKIAELLEKGRSKLERGEDGIPDLLGVIENFLYLITDKVVEKPAQLHQPEKNIEKLKDAKFISNEICGSLQKSLFQGVYRILKDKDHKKEEINYFDMNLFFNITEDVIDYLLERVIKHKIKVS